MLLVLIAGFATSTATFASRSCSHSTSAFALQAEPSARVYPFFGALLPNLLLLLNVPAFSLIFLLQVFLINVDWRIFNILCSKLLLVAVLL